MPRTQSQLEMANMSFMVDHQKVSAAHAIMLCSGKATALNILDKHHETPTVDDDEYFEDVAVYGQSTLGPLVLALMLDIAALKTSGGGKQAQEEQLRRQDAHEHLQQERDRLQCERDEVVQERDEARVEVAGMKAALDADHVVAEHQQTTIDTLTHEQDNAKETMVHLHEELDADLAVVRERRCCLRWLYSLCPCSYRSLSQKTGIAVGVVVIPFFVKNSFK